MKHSKLLPILLLVMVLPITSFKNSVGESKDPVGNVRVLIVGVNDNVKSNFYDDEIITQEIGISSDSIGKRYNQVIAKNIALALPNSACRFLEKADDQTYRELTDKIEVEGVGENSVSDLSNLPATALRETLEKANANYLLVINQHYLKRQEKPMRTIFHIVSYSLYDKDKKEVFSSNQFFTTMKLESPEKVSQISRKSASKIASSITKNLKL